MVQACGRLKSLQISEDFETTSLAQPLRQAPISVFREAMTFFIRLCQPNKTACRGEALCEAWSVSVRVCLWLNNKNRFNCYPNAAINSVNDAVKVDNRNIQMYYNFSC